MADSSLSALSAAGSFSDSDLLYIVQAGVSYKTTYGALKAAILLAKYPEVANYAALPSAASNTGETYVCLSAQGTYFINRKNAGFYYSDGASWSYLSPLPEDYFTDSILQIADDSDPTKICKFQLSSITSGTTRTLTVPNASGTIMLIGDAPAAHTHPQSEVTNLVTDLAGKAASSHTHAQSDITNLVTDLAGKAASSHTHAYSSLTSIPTTFAPIIGSGAGDAVAGNDSRLTDARTPTSHTHAQSDVTNLTTDLAGKEAAQTWGTLTGTSPALTFAAAKQNRTLTTSGNTTFTASGYTQGYEIDLYITEGDAVLRTLSFPSWTWLEGAPASIAASKSMRITLKCTGTTAASVFATYAVQT